MWFQAVECNAVNASLLLNLINNNSLTFLPRIFPFEFPTYPKNPKICDPILVNLLKMRPHYIVPPVVKMRLHPAAYPY